MRNGIPGIQGIIGLMAATGVACACIAVQTGLVASFPAWIACGAGLFVGWQAVKAANGITLKSWSWSPGLRSE